MKQLLLIAVLAASFVGTAQEKNGFTTYWDNGLKIESANKDFKIKLGGRIQYDVMFIQQDDSLDKYFDAEDGAEFRRARIYTSGTIYENIQFKLQIDFALNRVVIKDAYIQLNNIPYVGKLRVGQFKEPFGMEMQTSSNFITLMERPLTNQFDFDRRLGFMIFNQYFRKRFSWFAGYFYPDSNLGKHAGNRYQLTFRLTGLPIYKTEGNYKVLHLGIGYSYENHGNEKLVYAIRPEAHLAPKYLKLEIDALSTINAFNGEFALVLGKFSLQSEYSLSALNLSDNDNYNEDNYLLDAFFGTFSWFITGEHKNYNPAKTSFDRLKPKKNFGKGGTGAFELAIRYSAINLNEGDLKGGRMNNWTAGLNWYLNPATKFSFNYIYSDVAGLGKSNIYQMRFQVTF